MDGQEAVCREKHPGIGSGGASGQPPGRRSVAARKLPTDQQSSIIDQQSRSAVTISSHDQQSRSSVSSHQSAVTISSRRSSILDQQPSIIDPRPANSSQQSSDDSQKAEVEMV